MRFTNTSKYFMPLTTTSSCSLPNFNTTFYLFIYLLFVFHHRATIYDKVQPYSQKCNIMCIETILCSLLKIYDTTGSICCLLNILSVWIGHLLESNATFVHRSKPHLCANNVPWSYAGSHFPLTKQLLINYLYINYMFQNVTIRMVFMLNITSVMSLTS
jgi:hypothetical protein